MIVRLDFVLLGFEISRYGGAHQVIKVYVLHVLFPLVTPSMPHAILRIEMPLETIKLVGR